MCVRAHIQAQMLKLQAEKKTIPVWDRDWNGKLLALKHKKTN